MSDAENTEKKMVRLSSLTDVPWDEKMKKHDMLHKTIAVSTHLLEPGESKEVEDTEQVREHATRYVQVGALALGELPPAYAGAREKQQQAAKIESAKTKGPKVEVKEG